MLFLSIFQVAEYSKIDSLLTNKFNSFQTSFTDEHLCSQNLCQIIIYYNQNFLGFPSATIDVKKNIYDLATDPMDMYLAVLEVCVWSVTLVVI